jgi:hypothetical protein
MVYYRTSNEHETTPLIAEKAVLHYVQAHERLYGRPPRDVRVLNQEWVLVNGAQMRVAELEHLTRQLVLEHNQSITQRKNIVLKLLNFFRNS